MMRLRYTLIIITLLLFIVLFTIDCIQKEMQTTEPGHQTTEKQDTNESDYSDAAQSENKILTPVGTIQYKNYSVPLTDHELIDHIRRIVSDYSRNQSASLGKLMFTVTDQGRIYQIYEEGVVVEEDKYQDDRSFNTLILQLSREFANINRLTVQDLKSSDVEIIVKDHETTFQASEELYALIMEEIAGSATLEDPPMLYGTLYPYLQIRVGDDLVLRWLDEEHVSLKFEQMNLGYIGYIRFPTGKIWETIKEKYPQYFKRTGPWAISSFHIRLGESEFDMDNKTNRRDELVRFLKERMGQAKSILTNNRAEKDEDKNVIIIQNAAQAEPSYAIYPDDTVFYDGEWFKIDQIYEEVKAFFSVP